MKSQNPSDDRKDPRQTIEVVKRNWRAEVETAEVYRDLAERALAGEEDVQEFLRKSALEEKAHARALSAMAPPVSPRTALDKILKRERWHGRGGSWVADAIYGANDGLGAVFGIVSGVAGATNNQQHYILISGLAGMLASTLSMGAGAYLAAKSEAEVYEAEISRERAEVEENPEEEIEEMSLFYQLQGFTPEESQKMAERLSQQPDQFVQAMAQSELGLSEPRFWFARLSLCVSFGAVTDVPGSGQRNPASGIRRMPAAVRLAKRKSPSKLEFNDNNRTWHEHCKGIETVLNKRLRNSQ